MFMLREPVDTIVYPLDYNRAFDALLSKLEELRINIEKQDRAGGQIVARCLCEVMNLILWRCWGDKLLFRIWETESNRTQVDIFVIPNLFRIRLRKGEKLIDLNKIVSQLKFS